MKNSLNTIKKTRNIEIVKNLKSIKGGIDGKAKSGWSDGMVRRELRRRGILGF
ncbi:MAG: hypothetical protein ACI8ZX_000246 [Planctomycetota bacterium]|jgi:hypothetical protein